MDPTRFQRAAEILRGAQRIAVLTGAGISAESGVPTFRGEDGLWRQFRAEDLATPEAFARDPRTVWEWYDWRRGIISKVKPNPGHTVLARWEKKLPEFKLITQNVDGLHARAGSTGIVELHGNIWKTRCTKEETVADNLEVPLKQIPPACPACGALLRPHIVWFGESRPGHSPARLLRELTLRCDARDRHFGLCPAGGFSPPPRVRVGSEDH